MRNSYFISDLHLFARRSQAERHIEAIVSTAGEAHTFVLGGDIFDFRWTRLATVENTVDAAIDWLHELVAPHPECSFHYVLGNHDFNRQFMDRLSALSEAHPNLHWHRYWVRLGRSLFLHGDVADRRMNQDRLMRHRARWHNERKKKGVVPNLLYDLAVQARLHKLATKVVNRRPLVARRILNYLNEIGQDAASGVQHVYFGHTHTSMTDFRFGGLTFHNGGAPIKGLDFRIVQTVL